MSVTYPASPGRVKLIRALLTERVVPAEAAARLIARLDVNDVTNGDAKTYIDWLLDQPRVGGAAPSAVKREAAPVGVYELDGEFFAVREAKDRETGEKYRFARRAVITIIADEPHRVDFVPAPGAQYRVQDGRALTLAEVEELSLQFSRCFLCGRELKVITSKKAGIGPVCRSRFTA